LPSAIPVFCSVAGKRVAPHRLAGLGAAKLKNVAAPAECAESHGPMAPGKPSWLFDAIKTTGKLTEATEQVGMPYRQAWGLITAWSERMGKPLVTKEQGHGTQLTALGERLLWVLERINARLTPHLESAASEVERELNEILDEPNPALTMFASHDLVLAELHEFLRTRPGPKLDVRFYTEEFTHLAVAAAIASGVAHAGIGI
jgi:molybdate transport repressor ModE-like protein